MQLFPLLDKLRRRIEGKGIGPVRMSGSGSALFVTSENPALLQQWRSQLMEEDVIGIHIVRLGVSTFNEREVHHADF